MKNKLLIWGILLLSFLVMTFVYVYSKSNITVINTSLSDSSINNKVFDEFTQGKKITGEFIPAQNYLGQVLVRFYTYNRINTDDVTFRIKEKNSDSWYYEHTYKTDQFLPDNLFTFGFLIIPDSKGKTYQFEIESVDGTPEESVTLSKVRPLAALSFQYPKTLLVKNPKLALEFAKNKLANEELNADLIFSFLIYLNFIFLFLLIEYVGINSFMKNRKINVGVGIVLLGLFVMVLSSILLYLKKPEISLHLTSISYLLLVIGIIYLLIESIRSKSTK